MKMPGGSSFGAALGGGTRSGIGDRSFLCAHVASIVLSDSVYVLVYQCMRFSFSTSCAWGKMHIAAVLVVECLFAAYDRRCVSQLSSWLHCVQESLFDVCSHCLEAWPPSWRRGTVGSSTKVTYCMFFLAFGAERGRLASFPSLGFRWNSADGIARSLGSCAIAEVACAPSAIGTGPV